ncbi:MAG: secondary thiamine-phosphate synthase enzyme YjbQ [Proteobacteria bacterium]|nr:secondary thiamine-phosphate synthase enzyme YjbQ [Pseudomonadota bacterium]
MSLATTAGTDVHDLTPEVRRVVARSGVSRGQVLVFVPGSTGALTTIEYESGVIQDLIRAVDRLVPGDMHYDHDARWGDGNGYAHVRAALFKPSLILPVHGGEVVLGVWQQVVLLDFDNRPRDRRVLVQVMGE